MRLPRPPSLLRKLGILLATALLLSVLAPVGAVADERSAASVNLRTPFDCGQVWNANTRTNHNPQLAVDFQRSDAQGQNVRSSAAGTVTTVEDLGDESYLPYSRVLRPSGRG